MFLPNPLVPPSGQKASVMICNALYDILINPLYFMTLPVLTVLTLLARVRLNPAKAVNAKSQSRKEARTQCGTAAAKKTESWGFAQAFPLVA
jgi:hypothetical protein